MTEHERDAEAIFLAALDKTTPPGQLGYVDATCAGDPELLRRVRELLSCHEGSQVLLDVPPPGLGCTVDLSEVSEQPGTVIGPYGLLQQIGEGGMGTVYMAEQTRPVQRTVALKVTGDIDPALTGVEFDARRNEFELDSGVGKTTATSPDGKRIALIVNDAGLDIDNNGRSKIYAGNAVEIRDASSGLVIHTLIGHTAEVRCAAFSPDGHRPATASFDRTIKLWDVATGRVVFTLLGHTAGVTSLAISSDGFRIASGSIDNTARIWDATPLPDKLLQALEASYQQKLKAFRELRNATDDFQRAELFARNGQWDLSARFRAEATELLGVNVLKV